MPKSNCPSFDQLTLRRLSPNTILKPFNCGDDDLNDFFCKDAAKYLRQLLGVTYTFETEEKTVAFFTVFNDKIVNRDSRGRIIANRLCRHVPNIKRRPTYPAVKVGRFAVANDLQGCGLGTEILSFVKFFFIHKNKTGCRFITVDAYNKPEVIQFYRKNGFVFLTTEDEKEDTRLMYFDLLTFIRHESTTQ